MKRLSVQDIQAKKNKTPIVMLTAYDFNMAELLSQLDVDILLVGDSVGNVVLGYADTLPVTQDQMIHHCQAVSRGTKRQLVVADMPFLSYQISIEAAKANAGALIKEGQAHAVKLEISSAHLDTVSAIVQMGIPVMAHIGFTPQAVHQLGGYKIQGRSDSDVKALINLAKDAEAAGAFAVLLEMVPSKVAKSVSHALKIPTIGIGAGAETDGQVLVTHDLLGLTPSPRPRFVKSYAQLRRSIRRAVNQFLKEVKQGQFPSEDESFT